MNYLTIDEINNNHIYAPLGHEEEFKKRIMLDEFKSKTPKQHREDFKYTRRVSKIGGRTGFVVGTYEINFYQQFNRIDGVNNNYFIKSITLKDYKRFFKEIGIKPEKGAKKDWYVKMFTKYIMGIIKPHEAMKGYFLWSWNV